MTASLSSLTPSSVRPGGTITVSGSGFNSFKYAQINKTDDSSGSTLGGTVVDDSTVNVVVGSGIDVGTYDFTVATLDNNTSNSLTLEVVSSAPTPAPPPDYTDVLGGIQETPASQPNYSEDLASIKTEIGNLNTTIKTETNPILERMAVALETIAVKHSSIEQHVAKLRELDEGDSIHWVRPHDWKGGKSSFDTTLTDAAGVAIKSTINMENKQ